jgi:STIP1 family protein 1
VCPITLDLFQDPVVTPYGHTYERSAILAHLERTPVDPLTNNPLTPDQLIEHVDMRNAVARNCGELVRDRSLVR